MHCENKYNAMPLIGRTMIRILIEEIRTAGLDSADTKPRPAR
jgi:hypothetical protein